MKRIRLLLVAAIVAVAAVIPASAQFKVGPKVGTTVTSLKFDRDVFDVSNRAGFTGGLMCEFTVPVVGIGFDLSAMYVHRSNRWQESSAFIKNRRDYVAIPLNVKWKFGLPLVKPFITTGPEVAFLTSSKAVSAAITNGTVDWSWNIGFGLEVLSHLQVAASYGIGINKAVKGLNIGSTTGNVYGRDRAWTITAAYLF